MIEIYYAKIKDHDGWELITCHKGQYLSDNMEEINEDRIIDKFPLSELCGFIERALDYTYPGGAKLHAAKALVSYIEEYFLK